LLVSLAQTRLHRSLPLAAAARARASLFPNPIVFLLLGEFR
jgi:hypothetical protein